ncbi:MAG: hypothetical protein IJ876_06220 [Elusimicrobiaceae bacterium]|nr:hypothetical protein [Elusimicrobiaceae bacterium]
MFPSITLLDCTLRDGGLGLLDAYQKGYDTVSFDSSDRSALIQHLSQARINIIELGSIDPDLHNHTQFAVYPTLESLSKTIPNLHPEHVCYAALYRGPDTPLSQIPPFTSQLCEFIRVIIRYSELQKSLDFCAALAEKGYKVCIQPMLTMRYLPQEIEQIIIAANEMNAYALYFVDSYGYMLPVDIDNLFNQYNATLNSKIKIGFHAHNNMSLAFSNTLHFLEYANTYSRDVIIDSCLTGLGQGAGNLQTEIISYFLNQQKHTHYNYTSVLDGCEIIDKLYQGNSGGYNVTHLLPALHKTAYKYATELRKRHRLSFAQINDILSSMSPILRHRYTDENLDSLIKQYKQIKKIC